MKLENDRDNLKKAFQAQKIDVKVIIQQDRPFDSLGVDTVKSLHIKIDSLKPQNCLGGGYILLGFDPT